MPLNPLTWSPIFFHFLIIIASLGVLSKASGFIVWSISDYAKKIGVSKYLIGFFVISIATAIPEFVAALSAAEISQGGIVFGTIMGSNLFKIPLMGIIFIIAKKINITQGVGGNAPIITLLVAMLPILLAIDGTLSKIDGIILVIAFFIYIGKLWHAEKQFGKIKGSVGFTRIAKDIIIFGLSIAASLLAARWLVLSSVAIGEGLEISPYLVGLLVIGIGSSAPELSVQFTSIKKHHHDIAFGNVIGSIIANAALVLGIVAIIYPIEIQFSTLINTAIFLTIGLGGLLYLVNKEHLTWKSGVFLIAIYLLFIIGELVFG